MPITDTRIQYFRLGKFLSISQRMRLQGMFVFLLSCALHPCGLSVAVAQCVFLYVRMQLQSWTDFVKFTVFWDVAPCSYVEVDRRLTGAYCLHHQGALMMEAPGRLQRVRAAQKTSNSSALSYCIAVFFHFQKYPSNKSRLLVACQNIAHVCNVT
jgi:hypothetical protein